MELRIQVDAGDDAEQRDDLTRRLRQELLQLEVDGVEIPSAGEAPPGAKGVDMAAIGTLIVTVGQTATTLGAVLGLVQSWVSRAGGGGGTVEISTADGDSIKVAGRLSPEQRELVKTFVDRQASKDDGPG